MPLSPTDQLHLNTAAGLLQIGEPMDAWTELERITPLNRAKTEVLTVRLAVCRALKDWELAEEIARTLIRREPGNVMHVVSLAEAVGHREGPAAAAAVYEFAIEQFPDFAPLRVSLAVELVKAAQVDEAKRVLKSAFELDTRRRGLGCLRAGSPGRHRRAESVARGSLRATGHGPQANPRKGECATSVLHLAETPTSFPARHFRP
jgi:tetratricopeptide (TPR) repeat protein